VLALAATVVATALFAPPVTVGKVGEGVGESYVQQTPDPLEGEWLQFPTDTGYRLLRVGEHGRPTPIWLPPRLRGEGLTISPLQDGWTVAVARYVPPGLPYAYCCRGIEEPDGADESCCEEWVMAQHGPSGRWTQVQRLPHSRGPLVSVSAPVEHHRHIEIAWAKTRSGEDMHVAVASLGGRLGPAHQVKRLLPGARSEETYSSSSGSRLYAVGEYGSGVDSYQPSYVVERPLYGNGTLGPAYVLKDRLLSEKGTFFAAAGGAEMLLYSAEGPERLLVALRARHARHFGRSREVIDNVNGSPEEGATQSTNGRLLLTVEDGPYGHEKLEAVTVSPTGAPERKHLLEAQPGASSREFASAIDDDGDWLIASTSTEHRGPVWVHAYSPNCPYHRQRTALPGAVTGEDTRLTLIAGPHGVFHLSWIAGHDVLKIATIHVACRNGVARRRSSAARSYSAERTAGER
jgi:hypothetical protein